MENGIEVVDCYPSTPETSGQEDTDETNASKTDYNGFFTLYPQSNTSSH